MTVVEDAEVQRLALDRRAAVVYLPETEKTVKYLGRPG